jgi:O-antigen ligase
VTIGTLSAPPGGRSWLLAGAVGLAIGAAAAFSIEIAIGALLVLLASYAFARSTVKAEVIVALFWLAFCFYETIFATVTVPGFFYPFYAAFALTVALSLLRDGIRVEPIVLWLYGGFLVIVALSFLGFTEPIDFDVVQRVFAYVFGLLIALQFGSWRGLRPVLVATVTTGVVISAWVINAAIQAGFRYRGDIGVDQNVVTFFIGFGAVVALAAAADLIGRPGRRGRLVLLMIPLGIMLYGIMLLASRGIALALALAVLAITVRVVLLDPRKIGAVLVALLLAASTVVLPGGDGLVERFTLQDTQTANERLPIWVETIETFVQGDAYDLVLGRGFGSSRIVVQQAFGGLTSTHNAFLQILYEFGLIGLALFVGLHAFLAWRAFKLGDGRGLVMFGLVWYLVGANLSINAPDGPIYWTALGVTLALGLWGRPRPTPPAEAPAPAPADAPIDAPATAP